MKNIFIKIKDKIFRANLNVIGITVAITIVIIASLSYITSTHTERKNSKEDMDKYNSSQTAEDFFNEAYGNVMVHIKGEVNNPGVYEFTANTRISEAIEKAGGFTENADRDSVNLAEKVKDEMEIDVKSKSKSNSYNSNYSKFYKSGNTQNKSSNTSVSNSAQQAKITVNINSASAGELMSAGFSQSQANAIIEFRDYKGAFGSVTDLLKVNGITQDVLSSIIGNLTV